MFLKAGGRDDNHSRVNDAFRPITSPAVKSSDSDLTVRNFNSCGASLIVEAGVPGIQYSFVDSSRFQKILIVAVVAPSGIDPKNPPAFSPMLLDNGLTLQVLKSFLGFFNAFLMPRSMCSSSISEP